MPNLFSSNIVTSRIIQQSKKSIQYDQMPLPTQNQILSMFQKNGFKSNNVITKAQLKQLFDRQYANNNIDNQNNQQDNIFSYQLFDQLWGHLQLLSDSTVKIQNITKVIHDALVQLQKKIHLISSQKGLKHKNQTLEELKQKQKQLTQQLDHLDAEYNYHQQKIKSQRNAIQINIGIINAQINKLKIDKQNFQNQFRMLIITIGEHSAPIIQTKILMDGLMSLAGLEKKENSNSLKFIFILTIIDVIIQLYCMSYKNSFLTMIGLCSTLYILFCGYYSDKSVNYLIILIILSMLFDGTYVYLNMFTKLIINPIIFTFNTVLKYVGMISILVSIVIRLILIIKLFSYREIPKVLQYFQFWGEQVILNRRVKQFSNNYESTSRV